MNIQVSNINQKSNNTVSAVFCTGATFVRKSSCLFARIVSFDTAGLHLPTFCFLEPYPSKHTGLDLSHVSLTLMTLI